MLSLSIVLDRLTWTRLDLEELTRLVISSYRWIKRGIVGQAYKRHLWEIWETLSLTTVLVLEAKWTKQAHPHRSCKSLMEPHIYFSKHWFTGSKQRYCYVKHQTKNPEGLQGCLARAWDQGCHPTSCRCLMWWLSLLRSPREVWENHLDLASFHGMLWLVPSLKAPPASLLRCVECCSIACTSVASLLPFRKQAHWKSWVEKATEKEFMNRKLTIGSFFEHVPTGARAQVNLETKSTYQVEQTCGSHN